MDANSCSGSGPVKGILSHHDRNRGPELDRAIASNVVTEGFRTPAAVDRGHQGRAAFLNRGFNDELNGTILGAMAPNDHTFMRSAHPIQPLSGPLSTSAALNGVSRLPQNGLQVSQAKTWSKEYGSSPSRETTWRVGSTVQPANQVATSQTPRMFHQPVSAWPRYSNAGLVGPMPTYAPIGAEPHGQFSDWLEAHKPPLIGLQDIDEALKDISDELTKSSMMVDSSPGTQPVGQPTETSTRNIDVPAVPIRRDASSSSLADRQPISETGCDGGKSSAISDVARKILEAVDHEEDEKWKESSFLALMRDLRDGRKEVLDDGIFITN